LKLQILPPVTTKVTKTLKLMFTKN